MLDQLYMQDLADAMKIPAEPLPTGKVTVSGPQVETQPKQPEMGTITGIPQTAFEKALETSGVKLSELGDMIDQSAPGTLNTLLGREVPIIGNLKLRDFLPFVGSKDEGKLTGTPAALIAAGTGQPLRGQPVVGSAIGPDGQRYYGTSGSPAMLSEDVGTAVMDVATLGLGKPLAAGAKKAVKATKNLPVGMSTKAVGQGVDELGFYSAAKQAVDAIQQPKGTGEQFLKQIEKTPGVKPEEVKWTGLDDFLKSKKSVTKAEVQDYLDKNRVEVKEVQMGGGKSEYPYRTADEWQGAIDKAEKAKNWDEAEKLTMAWEEFELGGKTKFAKYTLPGGENYREILLTLPATKIDVDKWNVIRPDGISDGFYSSEQFAMDRANAIGGTVAERAGRVIEGGYMSPHFDQPNILAHMRVNDRVDADGKKVLFVEEVQSDWHQAGRKKGYQTKEVASDLEIRQDDTGGFGVFDKNQNRFISVHAKEADAQAYMQKTLERRPTTTTGVPDAPFKTTWHELAMKRAIQMASEGGYDRIAFTTGKTQAERFDLSKQVNSIDWKGYNERGASKIVNIMPTEGNLIELPIDANGVVIARAGGQFAGKPIDEIVGKDIAKQIMDTPGGDLAGKGLAVGGEGMKGFYDDILPKFLNKYAKKWDARVGMTELGDPNAKVMKRGNEYQVWSNNKLLGSGKTEDEAKASAGMASVNYIDVTPKMRESVVTKGQPLFAVGAGGAGAAATQEENK